MILIALLGQTCSGKSEMAVELAEKLGDTWIINCDSRQIYKELDLGTGKVEGQWENETYYYKNIKHFLIDYVAPKINFGLVDYIQDFIELTKKIDLPKYLILTGGTGLYARAILEKYELGIIKKEFIQNNEILKRGLQELNLENLQLKYDQLNINNPKILNPSDYANPRRLVNWILRKNALEENWLEKIQYPSFSKTFNFAINANQENLKNKIKDRIVKRIEQGLLQEVESLLYLCKDRLFQLGLEYKYTYKYIMGELGGLEWKERLFLENYHYAKRQLTWLKKQSPDWIHSTDQILESL